jgi:hypothetical protein
MSSPGTTKREFLWPCNVGDQRPTASEGNSPLLTHYSNRLTSPAFSRSRAISPSVRRRWKSSRLVAAFAAFNATNQK